MASGRRRSNRQAFVDAVLSAVVVEDYGLEIADEHAKLLAHTSRFGTPRGAHDLIIAATARARNRVVLSSDSSAFADLPGVVARGTDR